MHPDCSACIVVLLYQATNLLRFNNTNCTMTPIQLSSTSRFLLLLFAVVTLLGPNGLFLYYSITNPDLLGDANSNPIALAFMIEAMMLLGLFLVYIWSKTKSLLQVALYLGLSFIGSLAFSFAIYLFVRSKPVHSTRS